MRNYQDFAVDTQGNVIPGAIITVFLTGTASKASLFSDSAGTLPILNPLQANAIGGFNFYVANGRYDIQISGSGVTTRLFSDSEITSLTTSNAADTLTKLNALQVTGSITAVGLIAPVTGNLTGNVTGNLTGNATGVFISGSANPALTGAVRLANADILTIRNKGGAGTADLSILSTAGLTGNDTINLAVDANISTVKLATSSNLQIGLITNYAGVATVANGVPSEVARIDSLINAAAIIATTLYPVTVSGLYRISWAAKVVTAATTSSTLGGAGGFQVVYTDADDSVVVTPLAIPNAAATGNTTGTQLSGVVVVNAKSATNIQYQFGYTSAGVTPMQYALHIRLEAI